MQPKKGRLLDDQGLVDEYLSKEYSRRQMLRQVALATAGLALACQRSSTGPTTHAATSTPGPQSSPATQKRKHLVGMGYHESDEEKAILAALEETIGLSMIKPKDSVYLKVNTNSGDPFPYSTSTRALLAVGGMLRDLGVTDIRIGDRSFWGDENTAKNFERNGISAAAKKLGTKAIVFDDEIDWVKLPGELIPDWVGDVRLPRMVTEATHIINMPCVKTHFIATFTMSLKNCLGLIHAGDRKREGNLRYHAPIHDTLGRQIAQINKAFTPSMNLLNGYQSLVTGGPTPTDRTKGKGGDVASPKVVIASADRVAADVTGVAVLRTLCPQSEGVMQTTPFENPQIAAALKAGLGIQSANEYDLSGPTVPTLERYLKEVLG